MEPNQFKLKSKVWQYPGMAGWYFLTLPKKYSQHIAKLFADQKRGWGSLPVTITISQTTWNTSIFPDKKSGTYLLPLKAAVRKKEKLTANQLVTYLLEIRI